MSALMNGRNDWQTPPWLVQIITAAMGGGITLDAATCLDNPVGAERILTPVEDALAPGTDWGTGRSLFLNPPGGNRGKTVRAFWEKFSRAALHFEVSCWVGFNLDQLRFVKPIYGGSQTLVVPRKRVGFVNPDTGLAENCPQIGTFLYFNGACKTSVFDKEKFNLWGFPGR